MMVDKYKFDNILLSKISESSATSAKLKIRLCGKFFRQRIVFPKIFISIKCVKYVLKKWSPRPLVSGRVKIS